MSTSPPLIVADRYRLIAPLGQGGMGRVWRATDVVLHREVAIKELVPPPGLTPDERREMRERSLREARAIARLNNINVVRVFDVLRTDADPWIVMEYVPSRSLQDILAADGPFAPVRAAEIGLGVLNALRAAHRAGVVHRDVKPGNVLIGEDGRVVLTDFGLATVPGDPNVTRTGLVLGSPAYIAPERARDGTAGPGADLWSLGATLYAAVEGNSPFGRPSAIATLAALATENPPPARNAGGLKPVLNGLLRKDPAHRINAEEAERLLLRATGRRSKLSFPMSPTMRRPGIGRERPSAGSNPPVVPGVSASAPVVPGPRPPVTPARPGANPPVAPGRAAADQSATPGRAPVDRSAAQGRAGANPPVTPGRAADNSSGRPPVTPGAGSPPGPRPIFAPGKASVGRAQPETPTRVDAPRPPALDATKIENPDRSGTGTAKTPPPPAGRSSARGPALDATMRGSGSAFGQITADEVAAHRKRAPGKPPSPRPTTPPEQRPAAAQPATTPALPPEPTPAAAQPATSPAPPPEPTPAAALPATTPTTQPESTPTSQPESTPTSQPELTPAAAEPTTPAVPEASASSAPAEAPPTTSSDVDAPAEKAESGPAADESTEAGLDEAAAEEPTDAVDTPAEEAAADESTSADDTPTDEAAAEEPTSAAETPTDESAPDESTSAKDTPTNEAAEPTNAEVDSNVSTSTEADDAPAAEAAQNPTQTQTETTEPAAPEATVTAPSKRSRKKSRDRLATTAAAATAAATNETPEAEKATPEPDESSKAAIPAARESSTKTAPQTRVIKTTGPDSKSPARSGTAKRPQRSPADRKPALTPTRVGTVPAARKEAATAPVSGVPGFAPPSRPAWQPMTPRNPSTGGRGVTVFGVTLTRRQTGIAIAVLVAVLVALVVLVPRAFGSDAEQPAKDDGRKAGAAPAASATKPPATTTKKPSPSAAAPSSAAPVVSPAAPKTGAAVLPPKGWYRYKDRTGFSVLLPKGTDVSPRSTGEVYFTRNNRLLIVDQRTDPEPDPVADWEQQERERRGTKYPNYDRIKLEAVDYFVKAADWEFTYRTTSGNPQHAVKRGFITKTGKQAYGLSWYTSPGDWAASQKDLKLIYQGFQPRP